MRALPAMLLLLAATARADTLVLRGGGRIDGVIVGETSNDVTITMGPGKATFKRDRISAIERGDAAANRELTTVWQERYFADPRNLPPELHDTAAKYRTAADHRSAAEQAMRRRPETLRQLQQATAEREKIRLELGSIAGQLAALGSGGDIAKRNALALRNNELVGRVSGLEAQRKDLAASADRDATLYLGFLSEAAAALDAQTRARKLGLTNESARIFFEKTAADVAAWRALIGEIDLAVDPAENGHVVVSALVNGARNVRLLVDTGASMVTLSEKAAARCGVHWNRADRITVRLANGTTAEVYPTVLQELTVQGVSLAGVEAAVVPNGPEEAADTSHDGLLGMSFLSAFTMQMDPAAGRLILRRKSATP